MDDQTPERAAPPGSAAEPDPAATEAWRALPDDLRSVLVEIWFRRRTVAETATVLGVPVATVKVQALQALQALRDALGGHGCSGAPHVS